MLMISLTKGVRLVKQVGRRLKVRAPSYLGVRHCQEVQSRLSLIHKCN